MTDRSEANLCKEGNSQAKRPHLKGVRSESGCRQNISSHEISVKVNLHIHPALEFVRLTRERCKKYKLSRVNMRQLYFECE